MKPLPIDQSYILDYELLIPSFDMIKISLNLNIPKSLQYHEIIIPTIESQSNSNFILKLISNNTHILIPGPSGVGKTVNTK